MSDGIVVMSRVLVEEEKKEEKKGKWAQNQILESGPIWLNQQEVELNLLFLSSLVYPHSPVHHSRFSSTFAIGTDLRRMVPHLSLPDLDKAGEFPKSFHSVLRCCWKKK